MRQLLDVTEIFLVLAIIKFNFQTFEIIFPLTILKQTTIIDKF